MTAHSLIRRLVPTALLGMLFLGSTLTEASGRTARDPSLTVDFIASGFARPTQLAFLGPDDLLVTEKDTGRVRRVTNGAIVGDVLDLAVNYDLDRGLLSIALHPDFTTNGWVYLYFTESSTGVDTPEPTEYTANKIVRYTFDGSVLTNPVPIISYPTDPDVFHSGGVFAFGPDGKLYHCNGDMQRNGNNQNRADGPLPDDTSAIVRLNDDGSAPTDNPFFGLPGLDNVYAYGLRNSFGLDFDPVSGVLWQTENGPEFYDEINRVDPGFNSGWKRVMGPEARDPGGFDFLVVQPGSAYSDPEFSFFLPQGITAVEFLESDALGPEYENDLFSAENIDGRTFHFELDATRENLVFSDPDLTDLVADTVEEEDLLVFAEGFSGVVDLATGPDGNLWLLEHRFGSVHRIRAKSLDALTDDSQLQVSCDGSGQVSVSGSYQVYGTAANLPVSSITTEFYLDEALPSNLLASYTETSVGNDADFTYQFTFAWPDSQTHDVVMVADVLDEAAEEFENNNVARVTEECQDYVVATPERPAVDYGILGVSPNPFNPRTTISWIVPRRMAVRVEVYDLKGRRIARLFDGVAEAGSHDLAWDATDRRGRTVSSGTYVVRIDSELGVRARSVSLQK